MLAAVLLASDRTWACAACFGQSDSSLAKGMNAGIFTLLMFVLGFWVAFGSFFVFIVRRARNTTDADPGDPIDPSKN